MCFKNIYYNKYKNYIHLWENNNGHTHKISFSPEIEYYVPDETKTSNKMDIFGNPVKLQTSKSIKAMQEFKSISNTNTCETTISEDIKYLQKRYMGQKLTVNIKDFQIATIDIELKSGSSFPQNIIDICPYEINLITVLYSKTKELITYGTQEYTGNSDLVKEYHTCESETVLLKRFIHDFRKRKVDILTGWNIKLFDIPYIINRCNILNIDVSLSPINIYNSVKLKNFNNVVNSYTIAGISILDGLESYKKFTYKKLSSYKLNNVGIVEVKEGKLEFEGKINQIYKTNWNTFVEYNIQDVLLTRKIELKKQFIPLIIGFCYEALIPFERVYSSIALITGYFLHYLHKKNIMFPDPQYVNKELYPGAYVYALSGIFKYLLSYDVESEYPHMIMMYNISPETLVYNPLNTDGLIKTPVSDIYECETQNGKFQMSGIYYRKDIKGILPEIVENIFNERKLFKQKAKIADGIEHKYSNELIAKNNSLSLDLINKLVSEIKQEGYSSTYYDSQQLIRKILINSMYGVLGNPHFAFYNAKNAAAITIGGRHLIQHLSESINYYLKNKWHLEAYKYLPEICKKDKYINPIVNDVVVICDTDSNYICIEELINNLGIKFKNLEQYRQFVNILDKRLFKPFFDKILNQYVIQFGIPQMINFKKEKIIYKKLVIKKKKYADLVIEDEGKIAYNDGILYTDKPKLSKTGIETVKTTTPQFCKKYLDELLINIIEYTDKNKITELLGSIYDKFYEASIEDISKNSSVRNFSKYNFDIDNFIKNEKIIYPKGCPQHVQASVNYNYLISKYNLYLEPVVDGSDVKIVYVKSKNELNTNIIGYIGQYPQEFNDIFIIDKETQWNKNFKDILQRLYDAVKWGKINIDITCASDFIIFD